MDVIVFAVVVVLSATVVFNLFMKRARQKAYLEAFEFPASLKTKIKTKYPHLSSKEIELVLKALREYFLFCHQAKRKMVAMPSQVVDVAWHEFILHTRIYASFCKKAIGRFLHHTPTEVMPSKTVAKEGIKRAWNLACRYEAIDPLAPMKLPLLFAIDSRLSIEDGFIYVLNCKDRSLPAYADGYCAADIGCTGDSDVNDLDDGGSNCSGGCGGD